MTDTKLLHARLKTKYSGDEWAYFSEVPNGIGGAKTRSADGLAMSLWPSRGLELIGFEIKSYRADWVKELRSPEKAEAICQFCDRWYIVAPKGLVKTAELPPTWGLLESTGKLLRTKVKAPTLTPKPMDRAFLAAILRKAAELPENLEKRGYDRGYDSGREQGEEWNSYSVTQAQNGLLELKKQLGEFEKHSGIKISRWTHGDQIGKAVKLLMQGSRDLSGRLQRDINCYEQIVKTLQEAKEEIDKAGAK